MFVACGIWCLADVSSVSPSSEQTEVESGLLNTRPKRSCGFNKRTCRELYPLFG